MVDIIFPLNLERSGPSWSWFDAELYGTSDAGAAVAARAGAGAALSDYHARGSALGYAPNIVFDPAFYVERHPDIAAALAVGDVASAYEHFAADGWRNRDPHWLFDHGLYRRNYADLTDAAVYADGGRYGHYLLYGNAEGRIAHHLFDPQYYLAHLPAAERPQAAQGPLRHYLESLRAGAPEQRTSPYFDPAWYLATYRDAADDVAARRFQCALHHYIRLGTRRGFDPNCDFSEQFYRATYPDVAAAVDAGHFKSAFEHFVEYGANEPRSPSDAIDLGFYASHKQVSRDMATGRYANFYQHLLLVGLDAGLPLKRPVRPDFALPEAEARNAFLSAARRMLPDIGRHQLDFTVPEEGAAVSVIMVLRNQFALTMQCLASLRSSFPGGIELILVDNASSDDTAAIPDLVRGAKIIRCDANLGFLRACNLALDCVTAPSVLYLNNDVVLGSRSVALALARLESDESVGAVGGKVVRTHGLLQEAGCILWRDGSAEGWLRDAVPDAPEANFVRDVDFCSGCFLMVRADLLAQLGGFDDAFAPAYYEEVDLCLRIQAAGYRVVYDPAITLTHLEYASSRSVRAATGLMAVNRATLRQRHADALRRRPMDRQAKAEAAAFHSRGRRVLFIEDTAPLHRLGSGYGRAADVLATLVAAGWQATVFPMVPVTTPVFRITAALPETAEVLWDRDRRGLRQLLEERRAYYDLIWVSRAHNLRQLIEVLGESSEGLGKARVVLDTEAVFSVRDRALAQLNHLPFDMQRALGRELEAAWLCDHIVAVNAQEAELISGHTGRQAGVVGFRQELRVQPAGFADRGGMLHVGALTTHDSPNVDALRWYLTHVQPVLENMLGADEARLTVAGHVADGLDLSWLADHPAVTLLGPVTDLAPLYARHRVFVAPTRFAAGVPVKVLEAAAHGLPVVGTDLLLEQLGWEAGVSMMSAPASDPDHFAASVAAVHDDAALWARVRDAAVERLRQEASPEHFARQLAEAVTLAGVSLPRMGPSRPADSAEMFDLAESRGEAGRARRPRIVQAST